MLTAISATAANIKIGDAVFPSVWMANPKTPTNSRPTAILRNMNLIIGVVDIVVRVSVEYY
jgi:hypothetical protein